MYAMAASAILNAVLDPLLIYSDGMGIAGAAMGDRNICRSGLCSPDVLVPCQARYLCLVVVEKVLT